MGERENNVNDDKLRENKPNLTNDNTYDLESITQDLRSARIISPAYAGRCGELNTILEYLYQATVFENLEHNNISGTLRHIAKEEMEHFNLLGRTLIRLGVAPIYTTLPPQRDLFYSSRYVNYCMDTNLMLKISSKGEETAIREYTNMLKVLTNEQVKRVITYILEQEKHHLEELKGLYNTLN